jgi:uncharacterized damage-inducible protein DinB
VTQPIFTAEDALRWHEHTADYWRRFLTENPAVLALPCTVAKTKTAGELLQHIVAVELRYAERLNNLPATDYTSIPYDTAEALYATHDRASALYRQALDGGLDWDAEIEFATRMMGAARATPKTIFFHALFHSVRHYAQLAVIAREGGYEHKFYGDYLIMGVKPA